MPMQVINSPTMPNGIPGPVTALVSDANTGGDSKVTYLYIGPNDKVLHAAGEWTQYERGFFVLTYDTNNRITEITEVS
jgi:hypothetical protein